MTPLGYILIPIGVFTAILSPKWAYRLFVFSIPFSGTAIANIGQSESASGFQAWMLFGVLWIVSTYIRGGRYVNPSIRRTLLAPSAALIAFVVIAALSLFVPIIFGGSIQIISPLLFDNTTTPLSFSTGNITALFYLIFGAIIALAVAHQNLSRAAQEETARLYLGVAAFVSVWGLFQFGCYLAGTPYPSALFNNSAIYHHNGVSVFTPGDEPSRVYSVATEPSILSQFLLTALPLTLPSFIGEGAVFSQRKDRACAVLILAAMLLSRSTTAIIGLLITGAISVHALRRLNFERVGKIVLRYVVAGIFVAFACAIGYLESSGFRGLANSMLLSKAGSYSGLERWKTISDAYGYFARHPILGLGWGSVTSHDLIVKLLANVGILGSIPFWVLIAVVFHRAYRGDAGRPTRVQVAKYAWAISFALLILTCAINEFAYVFGHFWFILGVAAAIGARRSRSPAGGEPRREGQAAA